MAARAAHDATSFPAGIAGLRVLGTAVVARTPSGVLEHFGGISGLDRDPVTGRWYLISDDRSEHAPARFYEARIDIGAQGLGAIQIDKVVTLRRRDGKSYPDANAGSEVPDAEALRIDPRSGALWWASEGDDVHGGDPFVRISTREGAYAGELPLPPQMRFAAHTGPRPNLNIEGLSFSPDGEHVWVSMEAPLREDGPVATVGSGALTRITRFGRDGKVFAQYAYPLDPVHRAATGGRHRSDNGISDILVIGGDRLLVVERSGYEVAEMVFQFSVRLYEASFSSATDIASIASLRSTAPVAMTKRLVLDLGASGIGHVDNIEGIAWGPRLPNGHATLLLVSDDNFSDRQVNQFIALEVLP
ncbi:MAG TPA: esterase-like activity of phytase family protein [Burkholderiaceae bacterium]|nr:esterase-like activity of phytase family protein [Burkholderiaceae bacterium]